MPEPINIDPDAIEVMRGLTRAMIDFTATQRASSGGGGGGGGGRRTSSSGSSGGGGGPVPVENLPMGDWQSAPVATDQYRSIPTAEEEVQRQEEVKIDAQKALGVRGRVKRAFSSVTPTENNTPPPEYNADLSWAENRLQVRQATQQQFQMPRFGEFTMQDMLEAASRGAAGLSRGFGGVGTTDDPNAGNRLSSGLGQVAAGLDVAQQYAPYATMAGSALGIDLNTFNPTKWSETSQSMGFDQKIHDMGSFDVALPDSGPMFRALGASIKAQAEHPTRITGSQSNELTTELMGQGITSSAGLDQHMDIVGNLADEGVKVQPSEIQMMVESLRNGIPGAASETENALRMMGRAATGANISFEDLQVQVNAASEAMQSIGLEKGEGLNVATQFTSSTGLSPEILTHSLEDPMFKLGLYQQGAEPGIEGEWLKGPGGGANAVVGSLQNYMKMVRPAEHGSWVKNEYGKRWISGKEKAIDRVAQMSGQSSEVVTRLLRDHHQVKANADLEYMFDAYKNEAEKIKGDKRLDDDEQHDKLHDLRTGSGDYENKDFAFSDILKAARQKGSPLDKEDIAAIRTPGMDPSDRTKLMMKTLKDKNTWGDDASDPKKLDSNMSIGLTSEARRFFKMNSFSQDAQNRREANSGRAAIAQLTADGFKDLPGITQENLDAVDEFIMQNNK